VISGADAGRALQGARRLISEGAEALLSIGLAGALSDKLQAGTLFVPQAVVTMDGSRFDVTPLPDMGATGILLGSDDLVVSAAHKARLQAETGALAVDMESHAAALAAQEAGVPFYVVRAISDDAHQSLPPSARGAVTPDGGVDTVRTVLRLLRRPQDLSALMQLGKQASDGHETLRSEGRALLQRLLDLDPLKAQH
jgi:nucleoside phosphorylase